MNVRHTEAVVYTLCTGQQQCVSITVFCFGQSAEPLPLADQERELRIQAEGLLLRAEMLAWERTGDFDAHGAASHHEERMRELIKGRSPLACERMALERGLPHA